MSPLVLTLLDEKVLAVILSAFGWAIAWLVKQARANRKAHENCEIRLARAEETRKADAQEIQRLRGSVDTLSRLLRKEIHVV